VFAVNSGCKVYVDREWTKEIGPLDLLFRETENTDHYGWTPNAVSHQIGLIKKIINNLRKEVTDLFGEDEVLPETTPKGDIARGLGCVFQQGRDGFGGTQLFPEGNGGIDERTEPSGTGRNRRKQTSIVIDDPTFAVSGDAAAISTRITVKPAEDDLNIRLDVAVETDAGCVCLKDWDADDGEFPIEIQGFVVNDGRAAVTVDRGGCLVVLQPGSPAVSGVLTYLVSRVDMGTVIVRTED